MLAGVVLILTLHDIAIRLVIGHSLYLLLKGYIFKGDLLSMIDSGIGVYGFISIFLPIPLFSVFAGLYLFVKGAYSLFMSFFH